MKPEQMARSIRYLVYASLALLVSSPVLAQQGQGPMYGPHMWNGGWSGWFFGPIMMIVFIAVTVVVVVLVIRRLGGSGRDSIAEQPAPPSKTPLDILKERFARGEIDKEEFEERRRVLDE